MVTKMVTKCESWQTWYDRYGVKFGQFIRVHEAAALRDAAPPSLRSARLDRDALAVGRYMRRWQLHGGDLDDVMPHVPGDTFSDPVLEYSKIVGFLGA